MTAPSTLNSSKAIAYCFQDISSLESIPQMRYRRPSIRATRAQCEVGPAFHDVGHIAAKRLYAQQLDAEER